MSLSSSLNSFFSLLFALPRFPFIEPPSSASIETSVTFLKEQVCVSSIVCVCDTVYVTVSSYYTLGCPVPKRVPHSHWENVSQTTSGCCHWEDVDNGNFVPCQPNLLSSLFLLPLDSTCIICIVSCIHR